MSTALWAGMSATVASLVTWVVAYRIGYGNGMVDRLGQELLARARRREAERQRAEFDRIIEEV